MATDGIAGSENRSSGAYGESVVLEVPLGTVAKDAETGEVLFELRCSGRVDFATQQPSSFFAMQAHDGLVHFSRLQKSDNS